MAAWNLTRQGINVLMLDAGTKFDRSKFWTHVQPWEARERTAKGEKPPQFFLDTKEQPYLTPARQAVRADSRLGARRQDERVGPRQPPLLRSRLQGAGERRLGNPLADQIQGRRAVLRQGRTADRRLRRRRRLRRAAGQQVPAPAAGAALRRAAAEEGVRAAWTSRSWPAGAPIDAAAERLSARVTTAATAAPGCDTASFFCSADHLLPAALKTGKLEIRSNAVVARVLVDENGLAKGVQYFDRVDGQGAPGARQGRRHGRVGRRHDPHPAEFEVRQASRTASATARDVIGRYLCEQIRVHVAGFLPQLYGQAAQNDRGIGGEHIYMPRFTHRRKDPRVHPRLPDAVLEHRLPAGEPARAREARATASAPSSSAT